MAHETTLNGEGSESGANLNAVVFTALKPQIFVEAPKASDAVQFYKAAFGAEEVNRIMNSKRKADQELPLILSAELKLGSSLILVSDLTTDDSSAPYVLNSSVISSFFFPFNFFPVLTTFSVRSVSCEIIRQL